MECYKCKKEMTTTPICINCGIIPITENSSRFKDKEMELLRTDNNKLKDRLQEMDTAMQELHNKYRDLQDKIISLECSNKNASHNQIDYKNSSYQ